MTTEPAVALVINKKTKVPRFVIKQHIYAANLKDIDMVARINATTKSIQGGFTTYHATKIASVCYLV